MWPLTPADTTREALVEVGVAEVLTAQLKLATDAERRHIILEVLGSLGESGTSGQGPKMWSFK